MTHLPVAESGRKNFRKANLTRETAVCQEIQKRRTSPPVVDVASRRAGEAVIRAHKRQRTQAKSDILIRVFIMVIEVKLLTNSIRLHHENLSPLFA